MHIFQKLKNIHINDSLYTLKKKKIHYSCMYFFLIDIHVHFWLYFFLIYKNII